MFDKSKKIIENLRNYLIHNNIPKLREIIDNKTAYLYYDKLEKIVEKIKISDLDRSKSLNLHIVLKGQNDKYKKIIHKLNEELQQNKEKENSTSEITQQKSKIKINVATPGRGRTCAARSFTAGVRLPYTRGPGMPGPYSSTSNTLLVRCL